MKSFQSSVFGFHLSKFLVCFVVLAASCLLLATFVLAEEEISILEEIVVTATRYEEKTTSIPANVTVISTEDIQESTAQNIPDLLRTEVGIQVNDITGNRRSFTVDLRGFGETASSNTLVLVDGRRVNEVDLSGVDWTQIPLERVERIEIIRAGSGSVLYGDNATGGVINIITKEGDKFKGGGDLATGSYSTFQSNAYVSGSFRDFSFHLLGRYYTSDGYRDNSDTEAKDFGANVSYYVKDRIKLYLSSGYHKDNTGLPGALKESDFDAGMSRTETKFPGNFTDVEDYYFQVSPELYFFNNSILKIDTSFRRRMSLFFISGDIGNSSSDSETETVTSCPRILLRNSWNSAKNDLILGIDYQRSGDHIMSDFISKSPFFKSSTELFDLKKKSYGYYIHDEINIADVHLSGGFRHDRAEFTFRPSTPDRVTIDEDLYTVGINYTIHKKSYVYFSFSKSFRYPLLDEFYNFNNTINTRLIPQASDNYEIGARHYFSDEAYAHLNFFRINTKDEIFLNSEMFTNENLDGVTRRDGIEISLSAEVNKWLMMRGGYTYLNAKIRGGTFKGNDVPNVPKHKATVEAVSSLGRGFTFMLNGVYIGERPFVSDFRHDFDNQDSYLILNCKISYQWKSLKAFLDINNITNKEYSEYGVIARFPVEEKAFYPSPKRNFLVGLSMEL